MERDISIKPKTSRFDQETGTVIITLEGAILISANENVKSICFRLSPEHIIPARKRSPAAQNALSRSLNLVRSLMASRNMARKRSFSEMHQNDHPGASDNYPPATRPRKRRRMSEPMNSMNPSTSHNLRCVFLYHICRSSVYLLAFNR